MSQNQQASQALCLPHIAYIPYWVQVDETISESAKLYFGQICGLARNYGYAWATDQQLADMKKTSVRNIQRWNLELSRAGFMTRETINIPIQQKDGSFLWEAKRKIYIHDAFGSEPPKRRYDQEISNDLVDSNKECGTAKNGGSYGTAKNGGLIKEHIGVTQKQQPEDVVVVSFEEKSLFKDLKVPDPEKRRFLDKFSNQEISSAVDKTLKFEGRKCDIAVLTSILTKAIDWVDPETKESAQASNEAFLDSLRYLDCRTFGHTRIDIGRCDITFIAGQNCEVHDIKDKMFKEKVEKKLKDLKN